MSQYQYKTRAELKNLAKDKLQGKYGVVILTNLALGGFHLLVLLIQSMVNPTGLPAYIGYVALSVMLSILLGIFNAGTALYYLNILCGQPFSLQDLFWGFKDPSGKCLKISAVISLADLFFSIPSLYFSYLYMTTPGTAWNLLLYSSIAQVAASVLMLPISLMLSQSFYLVLDYPQLSAKDTMKLSIRKMKGHKWRLFCLQLSFIPLWIAVVFTLGIGAMWLVPYEQMTYACFFMNLMAPERSMYV